MTRAILRAVTKGVLRTLMAHDVEGLIGDGHPTCRNGEHVRDLKIPMGALNLRVPKLRTGSSFPGFQALQRHS